MASHIEVYEREDGDWGWRLFAGNNEIVAYGEGYTRKPDAERGAADALNAASEASADSGQTPEGGE